MIAGILIAFTILAVLLSITPFLLTEDVSHIVHTRPGSVTSEANHV